MSDKKDEETKKDLRKKISKMNKQKWLERAAFVTVTTVGVVVVVLLKIKLDNQKVELKDASDYIADLKSDVWRDDFDDLFDFTD